MFSEMIWARIKSIRVMITDSLMRNLTAILLVLAGLILIKFESPFVLLVIKASVLFFLTVWLANAGMYVFTALKATKILIQGMNGKTDTNNEYAFVRQIMITMLIVAAAIVLISAYSIYYLESGKELSKLTGLPFLP